MSTNDAGELGFPCEKNELQSTPHVNKNNSLLMDHLPNISMNTEMVSHDTCVSWSQRSLRIGSLNHVEQNGGKVPSGCTTKACLSQCRAGY